MLFGIVKLTADRDIAAFLSNPCIDGFDHAVKYLSWISVDLEFERQARFQQAERFFGYRKINKNRIKLLQGNKAGSRRNILPKIQLTNSHSAGERSCEHLLRDDGANTLHRGGGGVARRFGGIEIGLGRIAALDQLTLTSEREVSILEHREIILKIGLLHRIVDFEERRAFFDVLAQLNPDGDNRTADLRRDFDFLDGSQGANRGQTRCPGLASRRGDRDRGGWGRRRKDEAFDHPRFDDELKIAKPHAQCREEYQDANENDATLHVSRPSRLQTVQVRSASAEKMKAVGSPDPDL